MSAEPKVCLKCNGSGIGDPDDPDTCRGCAGECSFCSGPLACPECGGTGHEPEEDNDE